MKCTESQTKYQKPMNSFFHYRKAKKQEIVSKYNIKKSHEISKKAAELWANESALVRDYYKQMSYNEHIRFKEICPNFDWQPWNKKSKKRSKQQPSTNTTNGGIVNILNRWGSLAQSVQGVSHDVFSATILDSDQAFAVTANQSSQPSGSSGSSAKSLISISLSI
ncbi:hypothetical protein HDV06_000411 [Boothiomyces sp. JEL0866]|nr:hypothetical protein HDV06_000411 [Boothiomyces sp. JEL0866]